MGLLEPSVGPASHLGSRFLACQRVDETQVACRAVRVGACHSDYPMFIVATSIVLGSLNACRPSYEPVQDASWMDLGCESCDGECRYESIEVSGTTHVDGGLVYTDLPPVGGDHDPCWAPWGVYEAEIGDEHWVHNMEHGGVVFLYNCPEDCEAEVEEMTAFVDDHWGTSLLAPYALMDSTFAVAAWGVRYVSDCFELEAAATFYEAHVDQGPESTSSMPPEGCMDGER